MLRAIKLIVTLIGVVFFLNGCGNGLPGDLADDLSKHGIIVRVSGFHAPISSRAGYIFFVHDIDIETNIIAQYDLKKIDPHDPRFKFISCRIGETPKELWGIANRPVKLKLKNGAQFENFYLLTTKEGRTYIFAEYAYG